MFTEEIRWIVKDNSSSKEAISIPALNRIRNHTMSTSISQHQNILRKNIGNGKQMCHGERLNKQNKFFQDRKQTIKNYKCKKMFGFQKKKKKMFAV